MGSSSFYISGMNADLLFVALDHLALIPHFVAGKVILLEAVTNGFLEL